MNKQWKSGAEYDNYIKEISKTSYKTNNGSRLYFYINNNYNKTLSLYSDFIVTRSFTSLKRESKNLYD